MPAVVIWRTRQRVQFLHQTRTKRKSTAMRLGWGHDPQTLDPHCVNQWLVSHGAHPSVTLPLTPGVFWAGESGCSPLFDIWYFAWWVRVLTPLWLYLSMCYLGYSAWWVRVLIPLWLCLLMHYLGSFCLVGQGAHPYVTLPLTALPAAMGISYQCSGPGVQVHNSHHGQSLLSDASTPSGSPLTPSLFG